MKLIDKKKGIKTIERILGKRAVYMGPPTFKYIIGDYVVDRDGNIEGKGIELLEKRLAEEGIAADGIPKAEVNAVAGTPREIRNLINMIHSKQYLLDRVIGYKAFEIPDNLIGQEEPHSLIGAKGIELRDGKVYITGFPDTDIYRTLAEAMIQAAASARWISPDETIEENEKFYMRAWLVRIGLGGKDSKDVRAALLKNLKGSVAFRTKESEERWKEKYYEGK